MSIAVIDTESFLCVHCHKRRLLAIAYTMYSIGNEVSSNVALLYVKPQTGCIVDERSIGVHGITNGQATDMGQPLHDVLQQTMRDIKNATAMAAHDIHADMKILVDEAVDTGVSELLRFLASTTLLCTKLITTRILRMKMPRNVDALGWKWPSLREAYAYATDGQKYDEHNPIADVIACVHVLRHSAWSLPGLALDTSSADDLPNETDHGSTTRCGAFKNMH